MKQLLSLGLICSLFFAACSAQSNVASGNYEDYNNYNQSTSVDYNTFYTQLSPYGRWVSYPGYGNVWQPTASTGFMPYQTGGHWVATNYGWTWASDYNWGWAPFHYGRWLLDPAMGWVWVPGYEWAPAWVSWGTNSEYYAWAPLAPGVSINTWMAPSNYWSYVPHNCIHYTNLNRYIVRPQRNTVNNITIINNYNNNPKVVYNRGPEFKEVTRFTKTDIKPVKVAWSQQPAAERADSKEFVTYRPEAAPKKGPVAQPSATTASNDAEIKSGNTNVRGSNNNVSHPAELPKTNAGLETEGNTGFTNAGEVRQGTGNQPRVTIKHDPSPAGSQDQRVEPAPKSGVKQPAIRSNANVDVDLPQAPTPVRQQAVNPPVRVQPQAQPQRVEPAEAQPLRVQPRVQPQRVEPQRTQPQREYVPQPAPRQVQPRPVQRFSQPRQIERTVQPQQMRSAPQQLQRRGH